MSIRRFSRENFNIDEWLRKQAEKISVDHSYVTNAGSGLKQLAFEEFINDLRNKPELVEKLNKALAEIEEPEIEDNPPCIISPNGGRWDACPHHKSSGGYHGYGFCIYRTDYDIMQKKDRNCKFKKTEEKLPEELFEI
jgi:hypothetical protein